MEYFGMNLMNKEYSKAFLKHHNQWFCFFFIFFEGLEMLSKWHNNYPHLCMIVYIFPLKHIFFKTSTFHIIMFNKNWNIIYKYKRGNFWVDNTNQRSIQVFSSKQNNIKGLVSINDNLLKPYWID